MRKHWLRGMLLGVSLALLLAGGVALADDGLPVKGDEDCLPCVYGDASLPRDAQRMDIELTGLDTAQGLCMYGQFQPDGPGCTASIGLESPAVSSCNFSFWFQCDYSDILYVTDCLPDAKPTAGSVGSQGVDISDCFGEWDWWVYQDPVCGPPPEPSDVPSFSFLFTDVCEVEEEFVPEPGSIMLLGTGLVGLAGYAALRWRARD